MNYARTGIFTDAGNETATEQDKLVVRETQT